MGEVEWEAWEVRPEPAAHMVVEPAAHTVVDMLVDMLEVGALQEETVVLALLGPGKIALLAVSGVVEAARALCRTWAAGRARTCRRRRTSMSDMAAILVVPGGISPASSRVVVF